MSRDDPRLVRRFAPHLHAQRVWDLAMALRRWRVPVLPTLLRWVLRGVFGADLPLWRRRPADVYLLHNGLGVVIHDGTRFRGPAIVFHGVTLGNSWTTDDGAPTIGTRVLLGAGCCVLGRVEVGDGSVVAANAVVTADVPPGHVAFGSPAVCRPREESTDGFFDGTRPPGH